LQKKVTIGWGEQKLIPQDIAGQLSEIPDDVSVYYARKAGMLKAVGIRPRLADLFCGAGGLTCGFGSHFGHVFQSVWATDMDKACVNTYNANFGPHCRQADDCRAPGRSQF